MGSEQLRFYVQTLFFGADSVTLVSLFNERIL